LTTEQLSTSKRSILAKLVRFSFWALLVLVLIVCITIFAAHTYLQSNEEKILEQVAWLNNGSLSCEEVDISLFENFPKASIVFKNASLVDNGYSSHGRKLLEVEQLTAALAIGDWRNKKFVINGLTLSNGAINIHKDEEGFDNLKNILIKSQRSEKEPSNKLTEWLQDFDIKSDQLDIVLDDIAINVVDEMAQSDIIGVAHQLDVDLQMNERGFMADMNMDLSVDELTFNRKNGSYLKDSKVSGAFQMTNIDKTYSIEPFELFINDQAFLFEGIINDSVSQQSILRLENNETNIDETLTLLPDKIANDIDPYDIQGIFRTNTEIVLTKAQPAL